MRWVVRLRGPAGVFTLPHGRSQVGRAPESSVLLDTRDVSRLHAVIAVEGNGVRVEDLGSSNGTQVNGQRLKPSTPVSVATGDRVMFGELEFVIELMRVGKS